MLNMLLTCFCLGVRSLRIRRSPSPKCLEIIATAIHLFQEPGKLAAVAQLMSE